VAGVIRRQLETRGVRDAAVPWCLRLAVEPRPEADGFRIEDTGVRGEVRIVGDTDAGLLHGTGAFLRGADYTPGRFRPGAWRGRSVPARPVRGIYFATHFHNYYHDAPVDEVRRYVEDLGLWGYNTLAVWFDMHHYRSIREPAAQVMIARLRALFEAARGVGMKTAMMVLANEAYADSPVALRANGDTGRAHYHVELCPSKPAAMAQLLRWHEERLEAFADMGLDFVSLWPYDQGGCACPDCRPWGANGFPRAAEAVARLYRRRLPGVRVILSTWLFDYGSDQGEWVGLARAFALRPDWANYLMVDSHGEFPAYPLLHGAPGGLPMLNFPEISMRGMWPWGGFGANPQPAWFERLWGGIRDVLAGGFPYSEGIFEDINKAVCARLYWDPLRPALETVREYAAFEFSPGVADDVVRAVRILEANHERRWNTEHYGKTPEPLRLAPDAGAAGALAILGAADARLPAWAKDAWRWRILLLRARMDAELYRTGGIPDDECEAAAEELTRLYWAANADPAVKPPTRAVREVHR
jgi:hypothetical protein